MRNRYARRSQEKHSMGPIETRMFGSKRIGFREKLLLGLTLFRKTGIKPIINQVLNRLPVETDI